MEQELFSDNSQLFANNTAIVPCYTRGESKKHGGLMHLSFAVNLLSQVLGFADGAFIGSRRSVMRLVRSVEFIKHDLGKAREGQTNSKSWCFRHPGKIVSMVRIRRASRQVGALRTGLRFWRFRVQAPRLTFISAQRRERNDSRVSSHYSTTATTSFPFFVCHDLCHS